MAVDALGNPLRLILTEGQVHDIRQAEALIEGFACEKVLADKGYDSDKFREVIASKGAEAVIPPKRSRKELLPYDKDVYQDRNLVERLGLLRCPGSTTSGGWAYRSLISALGLGAGGAVLAHSVRGLSASWCAPERDATLAGIGAADDVRIARRLMVRRESSIVSNEACR